MEDRKSAPITATKLRTYSAVALLVSIGLCAPGNRGYGPPWLWSVGQIFFFVSLAGLAVSILWRLFASVLSLRSKREGPK